MLFATPQIILTINLFIVIFTVDMCSGQLIGNFLKSAIEKSPSNRFRLGDIINSASDTGRGLVLNLDNVFPTSDQFFNIGKNLLVGYPIERAFSAINKFCSASLSQKQVKPKYTPDLKKMNYLLKTREGDHLIPINTPERLWKHPAFNPELDTEILVTGWFSNINSTFMTNDALETVWEAFKCRGNVIFVVIDTAAFVDTLYTWSAFNTEEIGKIIAAGLAELIKYYPLEKIHLVGHSLAAHIVGAAGRYFIEMTSQMLLRITGLDPASPCFNEGENLTGLSRGDAAYVDVIHSNPGVLGKKDPVGEADFYPNGVSPLPPGCITIICAHARAWEFYAETVYPGNEFAFMAVKCSSITALNSGSCTGKRYPMGYASPHNIKGNYFLKTERRSPFGMESKNEAEIVCNM